MRCEQLSGTSRISEQFATERRKPTLKTYGRVSQSGEHRVPSPRETGRVEENGSVEESMEDSVNEAHEDPS